MNTDEPVPTTTAARIAAQAAKSDPVDPVALPTRFPRVAIMKPAARKPASQLPSERPTNSPSLLASANDPVMDPARVATGDDDVASQPPKIP